MRLSVLTLALLPLLALALPTSLAVREQTADQVNALVNGINSNLAHGNQETQAVKTLQSLEQNKAAASDIAAAITGVKTALNLAISDRESNQALAVNFPTVLAGLAKVQTAQGGALTQVANLNGVIANDSPICDTLLTTFAKGFATNQNNLALVSLDQC
jgi:hypothetical protein